MTVSQMLILFYKFQFKNNFVPKLCTSWYGWYRTAASNTKFNNKCHNCVICQTFMTKNKLWEESCVCYPQSASSIPYLDINDENTHICLMDMFHVNSGLLENPLNFPSPFFRDCASSRGRPKLWKCVKKIRICQLDSNNGWTCGLHICADRFFINRLAAVTSQALEVYSAVVDEKFTLISDSAGFTQPHSRLTRHIVSQFEDESFQATDALREHVQNTQKN